MNTRNESKISGENLHLCKEIKNTGKSNKWLNAKGFFCSYLNTLKEINNLNFLLLKIIKTVRCGL